MNQIKAVNRVFLGTVLVTIAGIFLNSWVYDITGKYLHILILSQLLLIIPSGLYLFRQKRGLAESIGFRKITVGNIVLVIILAFLMMPLMGFINAISMLFVRNDTTAVIENLVGSTGPLAGLLMVALVPCILEESVYRGVFFQSYRKVNPLKGILLSGLLFGLIHQNFNQFSYAFAMGILFALVIEATGSILSTMIIHFVINGTSVLSTFLIQGYNQMFENLNESGLPGNLDLAEISDQLTPAYILAVLLPMALISTLLAFFVFRVLADNTGRWEHIKSIFKRNQKSESRFLTPSLVIGMVICLIIMVINEYLGRKTGGIQENEGFVTVIFGIIPAIKNLIF